MRRGTALLIATLALAGCGGDSRPKPVSAEAEGLPGYVVEADGHKVYFECKGSGSPTVVFLAGLGEESSTWGPVFDHASRLTRACEYDRYGVGLTATHGIIEPKARDARDQIHELEQLLANASIEKPYVPVGHSWGGTLARLYAGTHDDAKAVVFVDSSSPGQDTTLAAVLPPRRVGEPTVFTEIRNDENSKPFSNPENLDWGKSLAQAGEVMSLGKRPEIVITAGSSFNGDARFLFPYWLQMQDTIAGLSQDSVHVLVPKSSHFVQTDAPVVVQAAVRAAVNAVRDDRQLATCAAIFRGVADTRCLH